MPRKSGWIEQLPAALDELRQFPAEVIDLGVLERVLRVEPSTAIRLLHRFGGVQSGKTFLIDRLQLITKLEEVSRGEDAFVGWYMAVLYEYPLSARLSMGSNCCKATCACKEVRTISVGRIVYRSSLQEYSYSGFCPECRSYRVGSFFVRADDITFENELDKAQAARKSEIAMFCKAGIVACLTPEMRFETERRFEELCVRNIYQTVSTVSFPADNPLGGFSWKRVFARSNRQYAELLRKEVIERFGEWD